MAPRAIWAALWLAALAGAQTGQKLEPTFRTTTQLVLEMVTVTGRDGRPVEGLTARDFALTENGKPQSIVVCEFQRLAEEPARPTPPRTEGGAQPLVQTAAVAAYRGRRLLVLYFDQSMMSGTQRGRAIEAARRFIQERRMAADLISIVTYRDGEARTLAEFTDAADQLLAGVSELSKAHSGEHQNLEFGQNNLAFNLFRTDRSLAALQTTVERLGRIGEKKALVYFAGDLGPNDGGRSFAQMRALINSAVRAHVAIFPVDTRGLMAWAPAGDASVASPGGVEMYNGAAAQRVTNEVERSKDSLYALAADTGGRALLDQNGLVAGIELAQRSVSSHYVLGYYSSEDAPDGKLRRVNITLTEHPEARLEYRRAYYGRKEFKLFTEADRERQLEEALRLEDPIVDLPLSVEVNYFQLNRAEYYVPVSVRLPGAELTRETRRGKDRVIIQFIGEIRDKYGTIIQNLRDRIELKLGGSVSEHLASRALNYDCGFTLLPGSYRLKLLARDDESGRIATSVRAFEIPNLAKERQRVPISSVVLSRQRAAMSEALYHSGKDTAQTNNPLVQQGTKRIPNGSGVFRAGDRLQVFLEAYQPGDEPPRAMVAYLGLYRGPALVAESQPHQWPGTPRGRLMVLPIDLELDLKGMAPGRYRMQVTLLDQNAGRVAFYQQQILVVE